MLRNSSLGLWRGIFLLLLARKQEKIGRRYGSNDTIFAWFVFYLSSWKYYVLVNNSSLHDVSVSSGVCQGFILYPLLISMYVCKLEHVAQLDNFKIHLYADDVQCYFQFGSDTHMTCIVEKIQCFVSDLKRWMNVNFLLHYEQKTNFVEFVPFWNVKWDISASNFFETEALSPCMSIKTLGVLLDNKLSLSNHFNKVVSIR